MWIVVLASLANAGGLAAIVFGLFLLSQRSTSAAATSRRRFGAIQVVAAGCLLTLAGQYRLIQTTAEPVSRLEHEIRHQAMLQEPLVSVAVRLTGVEDPLKSHAEKCSVRFTFSTQEGRQFVSELPGAALSFQDESVEMQSRTYVATWQSLLDTATTPEGRVLGERISQLKDWQRIDNAEVAVLARTPELPTPLHSFEILCNARKEAILFYGKVPKDTGPAKEGDTWVTPYKYDEETTNLAAHIASWTPPPAAAEQVNYLMLAGFLAGLFLLLYGLAQLVQGDDPPGSPGPGGGDPSDLPNLLGAPVKPTPVMEGSSIGPATALLMTLGFLVLIAVPAVYQYVRAPDSDATLLRKLVTEFPTAKRCKQFEEKLEKTSVLAQQVRASYQALLTRALNQGSRQVVVGEGGMLFYHEGINFCTGEGFLSKRFAESKRNSLAGGEDFLGAWLNEFLGVQEDEDAVVQLEEKYEADNPVTCLIDLKNQLARRGIHLLAIPLPSKETIFPERLWPGYPVEEGPAVNTDFTLWKRRLQKAGVDVLDLSEDYWKVKGERNHWLKYDTHWAPDGVNFAAEIITRHLQKDKKILGSYEKQHYTTRKELLTREPFFELLNMLELPPNLPRFPMAAEMELTRVYLDGAPARGDDTSPILLLGDSFTEMYQESNADLACQLMLRLGTSVQVLSAYAGNGDNTNLLVDNPHCLDRKKVVIWEFVTRNLTSKTYGYWNKVVLPPPPLGKRLKKT